MILYQDTQYAEPIDSTDWTIVPNCRIFEARIFEAAQTGDTMAPSA
jgi:hypothetical protein